MARPKKDNADYFPHESGMRNDDRIKALRKKFKLNGYAIWNMLLEYLTAKDFFQFEYNDFTLEIIAGDFDADKTEIQEVISYCITLGLLQQKGTFIACSRLEKGLEPLLSKRKRTRNGVSDDENPQSIVKHSIGKKYIAHGEGGLFVQVKPKYAKELPQRIYQMEKYFESTDQLKALQDAKFTAFTEFIKHNPGRVFNDDAHVYNSFTTFCRENPPQSRSDNPFGEAEYNRSQWTDQAWRDHYKHQIQKNPAFRDHFKIAV